MVKRKSRIPTRPIKRPTQARKLGAHIASYTEILPAHIDAFEHSKLSIAEYIRQFPEHAETVKVEPGTLYAQREVRQLTGLLHLEYALTTRHANYRLEVCIEIAAATAGLTVYQCSDGVDTPAHHVSVELQFDTGVN